MFSGVSTQKCGPGHSLDQLRVAGLALGSACCYPHWRAPHHVLTDFCCLSLFPTWVDTLLYDDFACTVSSFVSQLLVSLLILSIGLFTIFLNRLAGGFNLLNRDVLLCSRIAGISYWAVAGLFTMFTVSFVAGRF